MIARRVAQELRDGDAVNLGFGISANVPRILLEEGRHGDVTWVIEQGAVGGVPLLDFQFGCASNAEAIMPSPTSSPISRAAASTPRCCPSCRSTATARVNVSQARRPAACHRRRGGFVDITARAQQDRLLRLLHRRREARASSDGRLRIAKEGKVKKLVDEVEHVSFSGRRAVAQGQDITYVTERCVMKLTPRGRRGHRDRAGRRPRARRAGPGRSSRSMSPTT